MAVPNRRRTKPHEVALIAANKKRGRVAAPQYTLSWILAFLTTVSIGITWHCTLDVMPTLTHSMFCLIPWQA